MIAKILLAIAVAILSIIAMFVMLLINYLLFDTSPTKDDECRGGHDF